MPLSGATVLQVIPHLSAGGAERTTIEIAEALKAVGAKSLVASVGGRLEGELNRAGGELIHIDIKKLGRIRPGGGWRVHGRNSDEYRASKRGTRVGYGYIHTAIDDPTTVMLRYPGR